MTQDVSPQQLALNTAFSSAMNALGSANAMLHVTTVAEFVTLSDSSKVELPTSSRETLAAAMRQAGYKTFGDGFTASANLENLSLVDMTGKLNDGSLDPIIAIDHLSKVLMANAIRDFEDGKNTRPNMAGYTGDVCKLAYAKMNPSNGPS